MHDEFFRKLKDLLREYSVEISAGDDGKPYGLHSGQIVFEFEQPYAEYRMNYISGDSCLKFS